LDLSKKIALYTKIALLEDMNKEAELQGHHYKKAIEVALAIIAIGVAYYFLVNSPQVMSFLKSPDKIKDLALSFGAIAPLFLILLQALQNILPLLPHEITAIATGFVFGPILGTVYTLIGAFLGSAVVFAIARKYGERLAEIFFDKKELVHFHLMFKNNGVWAVFLTRLIPIFPNDLVSFAAGLTGMRFSLFNIYSTLGFIFEVAVLSYLGSELSLGITATPIIILVAFIGVSGLVATFRHKIKRILIKDLHTLERDGKIVERKVEGEFKKIITKNIRLLKKEEKIVEKGIKKEFKKI
jgi:uncharacterized membrane protein YdjX (TVP38/TMEM64 family)